MDQNSTHEYEGEYLNKVNEEIRGIEQFFQTMYDPLGTLPPTYTPGILPYLRLGGITRPLRPSSVGAPTAAAAATSLTDNKADLPADASPNEKRLEKSLHRDVEESDYDVLDDTSHDDASHDDSSLERPCPEGDLAGESEEDEKMVEDLRKRYSQLKQVQDQLHVEMTKRRLWSHSSSETVSSSSMRTAVTPLPHGQSGGASSSTAHGPQSPRNGRHSLSDRQPGAQTTQNVHRPTPVQEDAQYRTLLDTVSPATASSSSRTSHSGRRTPQLPQDFWPFSWRTIVLLSLLVAKVAVLYVAYFRPSDTLPCTGQNCQRSFRPTHEAHKVTPFPSDTFEMGKKVVFETSSSTPRAPPSPTMDPKQRVWSADDRDDFYEKPKINQKTNHGKKVLPKDSKPTTEKKKPQKSHESKKQKDDWADQEYSWHECHEWRNGKKKDCRDKPKENPRRYAWPRT
ncbi:hypothetical protein BGW38_003004 [Lunasporangiospora selenospora]|uniref:Uncharacterized protein n=1 Tax=Lunasporangiospora selenospora TaxID=979761 RepID=A0A9P6G139_9FUNG|nr:hypothetical protein BGW38_003004 [Lunasporangiospora selenospora]